MEDGDAILEEILNNELNDSPPPAYVSASPAPSASVDDPEEKSKNEATYSQWAIGGNGKFMPVGATIDKLKAGVYEPFAQPGMWGLEQLIIESDNIYELPDMATEAVLAEVKQFWASEEKYRKHKLLYKRGLILWGPPGGGKSVTVKLLMNELIKNDGIVIVVHHVNLAVQVLKAIRRVEPTRKLIVVFEDIDEIISQNGEATVLSMLDGENNISNVLNLATTNFPELLGARIINRPSRFDRRIYVGMPGIEARKCYLRQTTHDSLNTDDLNRWVEDTESLSIAHLRELVAAVYCLDQPYPDVIERLKLMAQQPKGETGFRGGKGMGFALKKARSEEWASNMGSPSAG